MRRIVLYTAILLLFALKVNGQYRVGYLQKGRIELWNENYKNSIEFFNAAIKNHPNDYKAYYYRGFAKYYLEDFYGASKDLSKAIDILPEHADYYLLRGIIYSEQLNYMDALKDMNTAAQLDSTLIDVYYYRSMIFLDLREFENAFKDIEKVMASENEYDNVDLIYGVILSNTDRYDEAIEVFSKLIKKDSSDHKALIQLGLVYSKQEKYDEAISNFNYVIKKDTSNTYAVFQRGMVYMRQDEHEKALADLDYVLERNPDNQLAYFNRAIVQSYAKKDNDALLDYTEILRKNPDNLLVYYNMGISLMQMKDYENAIKSFTKVIEIYPDYFQAYEQRAFARQRSGDMAGYMDDIARFEEIKEESKQKSDTARYNEGLKLLELTHLSSDFAKKEIKDKRPQYREINITLKPIYQITLEPDKDSKWFVYECKEGCEMNMVTLVTATLEEYAESANPASIDYPGNAAYVEYHKDITTLLKMGYAKKALEIIDTLLPSYPDDLYLNFTKANLTLLLLEKEQEKQNVYDYSYGSWLNKKFTEVMTIYNKITKAYPDFYFAYYNRAYAWFLIEDYQAAIDEYFKAVLVKGNGPAYYNLGLLSLILDKKSQACTSLSKAGELGVIDAYSVIKDYCN